MTDGVITELAKLGVVPLVTLHSVEEAVPLARALEAGGIPVAEITFRSPYAIEGMKHIRDEVPRIILIAGTVHTKEQAEAAVNAGCKGLVTPAFDESVVDWALEHDVAILPGTAVPSDVEKAYDQGLRYAKFFPAAAYGGVKTLKALSGPFAEMSFLPTGGVYLSNAAEYMALGNVFAVGGSFPVPAKAQATGDWQAISKTCRMARDLVAPIIAAKR